MISGHTTPPFHDVTGDGWKKLTKSWLGQFLTPTAETSVASDLQDELGEIDGNYEDYDVLRPTLFHLFIVLESLETRYRSLSSVCTTLGFII